MNKYNIKKFKITLTFKVYNYLIPHFLEAVKRTNTVISEPIGDNIYCDVILKTDEDFRNFREYIGDISYEGDSSMYRADCDSETYSQCEGCGDPCDGCLHKEEL